MREVNAAWSVLSNAAVKDRYDLELRLAAAQAAASAGAAGASSTRAAGVPSSPGGVRSGEPARYRTVADGHSVIRGVLWLLLVGLLGAIFVFTAYAAGGGDPADGVTQAPVTTATPQLRRGDCVQVAPGSLVPVSCGAGATVRVVELVPIGRPCPAGSTESYLPDQQESACLVAN